MLSFHDAAAIAAAPEAMTSDPVLQKLIADRVNDWTTTDLLDLTHLAIIEPGDTEQAIIAELAFSPLTNPIDGTRFRDKGFEPGWGFLERHNGWFEMIHTVGNDGFAFVLFIPDSDKIDHELHRLCRTFAPQTRP
ncbi:hypothetical protein [Sphingomonas jaspsi]|uniref:hypothetical protein n=1 Tax=Sphingomonas jaspsi TaxID=392409 RepID=UPI0004B55CA5|nr:hypothetical protein [Sphingomonas jaspsi]